MKTILFCRVSSKEQEETGYSLDAQEKLGLAYAERKSLNVIKFWRVSESAFKEARKAFSAMVEYAQKHDNVKHIIFDVTDRMTRNDLDKYTINKLIRDYDKTIHFSRTNKVYDKNSGPDDIFMLDIEVADGGMVARPARRGARRRYSVAELLEGVTPAVAREMNRESAAWHTGPSVGRELP